MQGPGNHISSPASAEVSFLALPRRDGAIPVIRGYRGSWLCHGQVPAECGIPALWGKGPGISMVSTMMHYSEPNKEPGLPVPGSGL